MASALIDIHGRLVGTAHHPERYYHPLQRGSWASSRCCPPWRPTCAIGSSPACATAGWPWMPIWGHIPHKPHRLARPRSTENYWRIARWTRWRWWKYGGSLAARISDHVYPSPTKEQNHAHATRNTPQIQFFAGLMQHLMAGIFSDPQVQVERSLGPIIGFFWPMRCPPICGRHRDVVPGIPRKEGNNQSTNIPTGSFQPHKQELLLVELKTGHIIRGVAGQYL